MLSAHETATGELAGEEISSYKNRVKERRMPKSPDINTRLANLAREDQIRLAKVLADPPGPNDRLTRAAQRHAALIRPR
jgi:hypothetical protein